VLALASAAALAATPPVAAGEAAAPTLKSKPSAGGQRPGGGGELVPLPSPPRPPAGLPRFAPTRLTSRSAPSAPAPTADGATRTAATATAVAEATGKTWGTGTRSTLVLYDTSGDYGWLGELYAIAGGNLAGHFGRVTALPVSQYTAGLIENHTAVLYAGSTYGEALPAALINDVTTSSKPVVWAGFNAWQLAGADGTAANAAFEARYGWDPSTSYITDDAVATVTYKSRTLTRSGHNASGIVAPHVVDATKVTVLAQANCPTTCSTLAQAGGATSFPWAVRSANLTFVGEIPFTYLSETDRYLAYADLLYAALAPATSATRRAAVRLEDVSPAADPARLRQFADYLASANVPFSVAVIPQHTDPNGALTGGTPQTITLAQRPQVVSALKYMQQKGGTLIQHGTTHQFGQLENPYNGVSGDDFEFYRARCSSTATAPYQFTSPCANTDWVIQLGAVPNDSAAWATDRVQRGRRMFTNAGLTAPTIWETPHYSASPVDYTAFNQTYATRYERVQYYGGILTGTPSTTRVFGQFFPYAVTDVYGARVLPENLGNYESDWSNNNPPRSPADIARNAEANLVVTQATASFFFHPYYPLEQLRQTVTGIKAHGYRFVAGSTLR
jgi:uncharacterized protein YdaL